MRQGASPAAPCRIKSFILILLRVYSSSTRPLGPRLFSTAGNTALWGCLPPINFMARCVKNRGLLYTRIPVLGDGSPLHFRHTIPLWQYLSGKPRSLRSEDKPGPRLQPSPANRLRRTSLRTLTLLSSRKFSMLCPSSSSLSARAKSYSPTRKLVSPSALQTVTGSRDPLKTFSGDCSPAPPNRRRNSSAPAPEARFTPPCLPRAASCSP